VTYPSWNRTNFLSLETNVSLANSDEQFDGSEIQFSFSYMMAVLFRSQVTEPIFVARLACEAMPRPRSKSFGVEEWVWLN
jgi:hypothetical protein